jgi:hypothetical protein
LAARMGDGLNFQASTARRLASPEPPEILMHKFEKAPFVMRSSISSRQSAVPINSSRPVLLLSGNRESVQARQERANRTSLNLL